MKFSVKGLALASGILWGIAMLGMGLANLVWGSYGQQFLQMMASVYPGYHAIRSVTDWWTGLSAVRFLLGTTTSSPRVSEHPRIR